MATREEIASFIEARRKELGYSQESIAQAVKVSKNSYIAWEKGKSLPRGSNLVRLAKVLKTTPEQLTPDNDSIESRVERDEPYPSFQQFLDAGLGADLDDEQLARVRGDGHYGGDPGLSYFVLRAEAERVAKRHAAKAENVPDASRHPDGLPLKK